MNIKKKRRHSWLYQKQHAHWFCLQPFFINPLLHQISMKRDIKGSSFPGSIYFSYWYLKKGWILNHYFWKKKLIRNHKQKAVFHRRIHTHSQINYMLISTTFRRAVGADGGRQRKKNPRSKKYGIIRSQSTLTCWGMPFPLHFKPLLLRFSTIATTSLPCLLRLPRVPAGCCPAGRRLPPIRDSVS